MKVIASERVPITRRYTIKSEYRGDMLVRMREEAAFIHM